MKSIQLDEKLLGLVEMTSGLVNASFSLPKWQAVKMIFFAPCVHKLGFLFKILSAVFWLISPQYICMLLFLHMYGCGVLGGFLFLCPSPTKCFVSLVSITLMQLMHLIRCLADHNFASPCHSNDSYSSH